MSVQVTEVEDRTGGPLGPESFGYVYFSDGSRVGYTPGLENLPVWEPRTNGCGEYQKVEMEHFVKAFQVLREAGVITDIEAQRLAELIR
jgi:hypothetical protein